MMPSARVNPIASGKTAAGARSSTAVPKTTSTRKNVATASMTMPAPTPTPRPRSGVPLATGPPPKSAAISRPAAEAPTNCAIQYMPPVAGFIRPVMTKPKVTAGLKCPPEIAPSAATITAMVSPCAKPMEARVARPPGAPTIPAAEIERTPTKIRANVPIASATDCFSQFSDTILSLLVSGGLAGPVDNDRCTDKLRRDIELVPVPELRQVQLVVLPEVKVDLRPLIARLRRERYEIGERHVTPREGPGRRRAFLPHAVDEDVVRPARAGGTRHGKGQVDLHRLARARPDDTRDRRETGEPPRPPGAPRPARGPAPPPRPPP